MKEFELALLNKLRSGKAVDIDRMPANS